MAKKHGISDEIVIKMGNESGRMDPLNIYVGGGVQGVTKISLHSFIHMLST